MRSAGERGLGFVAGTAGEISVISLALKIRSRRS
jgi:hypothetical protein